MNTTRLVILGIAVITAALAAFLAQGLISSPPPVVAAPVPEQVEIATDRVLVLTRDVPVGEKLQASDFSWQDWPEQAVARLFVTESRNPDAVDRFTGAIVRSTLFEGEPMVATKIIDPQARGFMSALLTPGMRAISLQISEETGAGGFVLPNDRVDIVLTRRVDRQSDDEEGPGFRTDTIITNVRVLAIDQVFKEVEDKQVVVGNTATLELPPRQAELVALAQALGTVSLALRGWDGDAEAYAAGPQIVTDLSHGGAAESRLIRVYKYGIGQTVLPRSGGQ